MHGGSRNSATYSHIILTAADDEEMVFPALEAGADDIF